MKEFSEINFGVVGDSITQGDQWSRHVSDSLGFKTHHNAAVGSSVWYKRTVECAGHTLATQDYGSEGFAGISSGWEPTDDPAEMQMRMNNCAVVHVQKFLAEVKSGEYPEPDVFAFAYGTNDLQQDFGDADRALMGKSPENNADVDLFTSAGAMRWCIQTIMENFPKCRVFVLTPLQTATPEHNAKTLALIPMMKKIAGGMSAQVIDCYNNSGICEKFEVIGGTGRYLRDGLHPDAEGQALEGAYAAKEIRNNLF